MNLSGVNLSSASHSRYSLIALLPVQRRLWWGRCHRRPRSCWGGDWGCRRLARSNRAKLKNRRILFSYSSESTLSSNTNCMLLTHTNHYLLCIVLILFFSASISNTLHSVFGFCDEKLCPSHCVESWVDLVPMKCTLDRSAVHLCPNCILRTIR